MLSEEDVLLIHDALVRDFAKSDDPISPSGIRDRGLLASAVSRQRTSLGNTIKYPDPISNATTLMYGVCNDHVFYNGNKRTALVAMLAHLDRNNLTLSGTTRAELYDFMMNVAGHTVGIRHDPRSRRPQDEERRDVDEELQHIVQWITRRTTAINRGERFITYRELRRILSTFGYTLEEPKGNRIGIFATREVIQGFLVRKKVLRKERIGSIPWPGESRQMAIGDIRYVRKLCGLTEQDGCDSNSFYDYAARVDEFINNYRKILTRLAKV